MTPFQQSWLLLKSMRQSRLPGYEGQMVADSVRPRRQDGRGFRDFPRPMGPYLRPIEDRLNQKSREKQLERRPQPARIVLEQPRPYEDQHRRQYPTDGDYRLEDESGRKLSTIAVGERDKKSIEGITGDTPEEFRRKGYYRELIENLIRHGYDVTSDARNDNSHPFHENFINTLPPDINADIRAGRRLQKKPKKLNHNFSSVTYSHKGHDFPGGDWGDLARETRISVPFIDRSSERSQSRELTGHPNRNIVIPSKAAYEVLNQPRFNDDGDYNHTRNDALRQLKRLRRQRDIEPQLMTGADNPVVGSKIYAQTRLPGLYESDYERNWNGTQPLYPMDGSSRSARNESMNFIQQ